MLIESEQFRLEGTLKMISFQPPAVDRDIFHYTMLLRAPPSVALKTSRNEAARFPGHIWCHLEFALLCWRTVTAVTIGDIFLLEEFHKGRGRELLCRTKE